MHMSLEKDVAVSQSKVVALAQSIEQSIEQGGIAVGARLRSIRDAAAKEGVGRNTVVEAYARLAARGYVEARAGSGYYVRKPHGLRAPLPPLHVTEAVDVVSLLREQLEQHYQVRVGEGRPPASWLEGSELRRHLRRARSHSMCEIERGYSTSWGYLPLRTTIAHMLCERSIHVNERQVLLTQGANHALDLIVRHLLEAGDEVLVDAPGYYPLFGKLRLAKVQMLGVRRQADGPDLDALEAILQTRRPKVFFTQSLAHNPTGGSISLPKAHRLMQLAATHGFLVVEDDPFADLQPATAPRLAALDQLERVIYVSSFSKTLSADLRVGYIAAATHRINALCDLKMVTVVSTSEFVERVVQQLLSSGQYWRHLSRLRERIGEALGPGLKALERLGLAVRHSQSGGYYLWLELPQGMTESALVSGAAQRSIFLAPGSVFYPDRQGAQQALRVNVGYVNDARFLHFLEGALDAWNSGL